ncbi:MAG TPA: peptidoglycan editing factor PgeF [Hyphomicrobiaceae bacterium]|nr:peptidoglycan editing factor PgeF [Hyphomicrobiaceae bacterium]
MSTIAPLTAGCLSASPAVAHGFFTRHGGASLGGYASLNCGLGSQDDPAAVRENRARVAAHLGARDIVTAHQVHSAVAVAADGAWDRNHRPRADAIVTVTPGLAVGVLTADCAPVLFCEPEAGVVAAAHAGWRGALGGVIESTLAMIETLGGRRERVHAAVGPCIGQAAYEVGPEFEEAFLAQNSANSGFFVRPTAAARPHFDLSAYAENRLRAAGVGRAERVAACTYAQGGDFFSYRRSRARGESDYGRQISAIVLT